MVCQLLAFRHRDDVDYDRPWIGQARGILPLLGFLALAAPAGAATPAGNTVPAALRPALYGTLARDAGPTFAIGKNGCAMLPKQRLGACFAADGVHFTGADEPLALRLAAWGRGTKLQPVGEVAPAFAANHASYSYGHLTEWWRVLPVGIEQGFTLSRRPAGRGELVLALAANGKPKIKHGTLAFGSLHYGELVVTDATGKVLPSRLTTQNGRILIAVNDARAGYPLTVDPLIWIEQKFAASDGATGNNFGFAVAVAGTTAFVGAPYATVNGNTSEGAAYVFGESNGVWTQTQKLTASDGAANYLFGSSVALAGNTAVVGAPGVATFTGAAYAFTDSGGTWSQSQELVGTPANNNDYIFDFGDAVALSGTTALIGADETTVNTQSSPGAAYVFDDSGGTWTQTAQLTANDGADGDLFGFSVGLSGTTALIGARNATINGNYAQGAAYVFDDSGGIWTQTAKLTASDGAASDLFGWSAALEGSTALAGAPYATVNGNYNQGAAYVFNDSGGSWTQTQKLTASGSGLFGASAALSGNNALIGAPYYNGAEGAAYLFRDSGGTWTQTQQLTATDGQDQDQAGFSVALSGTNALAGAICGDAPPGYTCGPGAVYLYAPADLALAFNAPGSVAQVQRYIAQSIVTNAAGTASPAVAVTVAVPAAAAFVSANATQGSCSASAGMVTCALGPIAGNGGTATANVKFKATGSAGTTIDNAVGIAKAVPALTASAPTTTGGCPGGYTEHDGTLTPGGGYRSPSYQAPAGTENGSLGGPSGFQLYVQYSNGTTQHVYRIHGNEVHRYGPAGTYRWDVQAGSTGGTYTLCVMHP